MMRAGFATGTRPIQFIARRIVPGTLPHDSCNFWHFSYARNLSQRSASAIVEPRIKIRCGPSRLIPLARHSGDILVPITAARFPARVALIAGVLILVMPRLLNLVVAIYLICVGLIGMGVLKWFHL